MADTYDLAMQLFRVASEKQKIEKSQGKLKPEDEIEFTEASFNDFSQSLSREFSNLSPEEQKEAKRLLEYKINDNVSEVISGNVNQGFSLNIQSVRSVISSAIEIVEQQSSTQSIQSNTSTIKQNQTAITYQSLLDNYNKTHDVDELYNNFFKLSPDKMLDFTKNANKEVLNALLDKKIEEQKKSYSSPLVVPTPFVDEFPFDENDESESLQESFQSIMDEYRSGNRKFKNILESSVQGVQVVLSKKEKAFNPENDARYPLVTHMLLNSNLPSELIKAIKTDKRYFLEYYNKLLDFAKESVYKGVPPESIDHKYIEKHFERFAVAYGKERKAIESSLVSKYERSSNYHYFSQKVIDSQGFSPTQLDFLNSNPNIAQTYTDVLTLIYKDYSDSKDNNILSQDSIKDYLKRFYKKIDYEDVTKFPLIDLEEIVKNSILNGNIESTLKKCNVSDKELQTVYEIYDQKNINELARKTNNRAKNIRQCLLDTPSLSNLSKIDIDKIVLLMTKSYSNEIYLKGNKDASKYNNNIIDEKKLKSRLNLVSHDKNVIDSVLNIAHESNKTQIALKNENSPLMGISYYLDDVQKMLGFKETNNRAISQAIRLSFISSFPEPMKFDQKTFSKVLKDFGAEFDEKFVDNPESFSKLVSLIQKNHDRFMEEAIYSDSGLSRETIDKYNFEKDNSLEKDRKNQQHVNVSKLSEDLSRLDEKSDIGETTQQYSNATNSYQKKDFDINEKSGQSVKADFPNYSNYINSTQLPIIQQGGLFGFINRFRNNMKNRNKDEGIFTSIKNAFLNAKDNFSEEVMDNKNDNNAVSKENQSSAAISKPTNTLDEMSKRLREGINVDNLGVQNTKTNNEVRNSDQREAESEEEQL